MQLTMPTLSLSDPSSNCNECPIETYEQPIASIEPTATFCRAGICNRRNHGLTTCQHLYQQLLGGKTYIGTNTVAKSVKMPNPALAK